MSEEGSEGPIFGSGNTLEQTSRFVKRGMKNYFEQNGVDIDRTYFVKVEIEPSTHPLVKDPSQEVVFSYTPRPEEADADGYFSFGIFAKLADDATSMAVSGSNKTFQTNVSQSLDFKQYRKMRVGKRLLILTKIRQTGQVYCMVSFETYDEHLQLMNQGNHCKVFVEMTQKL